MMENRLNFDFIGLCCDRIPLQDARQGKMATHESWSKGDDCTCTACGKPLLDIIRPSSINVRWPKWRSMKIYPLSYKLAGLFKLLKIVQAKRDDGEFLIVHDIPL